MEPEAADKSWGSGLWAWIPTQGPPGAEKNQSQFEATELTDLRPGLEQGGSLQSHDRRGAWFWYEPPQDIARHKSCMIAELAFLSHGNSCSVASRSCTDHVRPLLFGCNTNSSS